MNSVAPDDDPSRDPALGVPRREVGEDGVRRLSILSSVDALTRQSIGADETLRMGIPKRDRILGSALSDNPLGSDEQFLDEEGVLEPSSKSAGGHYRRRFVFYVNLLILLFLCLGGVLLLFGELPNWWTSFDSLPIAFRSAARVGISLLIATAGLATAQLSLVFWRLRVTPSISGDAIDLLEARAEARHLAQQESLRARRLIEEFLNEYPLKPLHWSQLKRLGFDEGNHIRPLCDQVEQLLQARGGTTRQWLKDVDARFLAKLDEVAVTQIGECAKRVGFLTAAARSGLVDTAIFAINTLQLVRTLCEIYNVRPTPWATVRIATRIFVSAMVAEHLEQVGDQIGSSIADGLHDHISALLANALGKASGRISEGVVNAIMIRRLGFATIGHLRPIRRGG
jgi:hypothetical protein